MKRLVLMVIPALICGAMFWVASSCNKEQEEIRQSNHSTQWIPSERFLGVCSDDLCMNYLQVWKELFMEKTGYTESYFRKHVSVHGSGLEQSSEPPWVYTSFWVTYKIQVDWAFIYHIDVLIVKYGADYTFYSDFFPDLIDTYLSKEDIKKMPLFDFNITKELTNNKDGRLSNHERLKFSSLNSAMKYLNGKTRIAKYDSYWYDTYMDLDTGDWMFRVGAHSGVCPVIRYIYAKLNLITGEIIIEGQGTTTHCPGDI